MNKLKLRLLAAQIELHWWFIRRERLKGNKLLKSESSFSSPKLLSLNRGLSKHSVGAIKAQHKYESITGIYAILKNTPRLEM